MYIRVPVLSHPRHNWRGKRTDTVIYLPFLIQQLPPWDNSNFTIFWRKQTRGGVEKTRLRAKGMIRDYWVLYVPFHLNTGQQMHRVWDENEPIIVVGCLGRNLRNS
jgi:hypothetical protein